MNKLTLPDAHKLCTLPAIAAILFALSGCVGMSAPYPEQSVEPENYDLIPVTAEVIATQALDASREDEQVPISMSVSDYRYVIRPADILLISVPTIVSFNSANAPSVLGAQGEGYVVYPDGTIYLPFSGPVNVGGLTLKEAQEVVVKALSGYLRSPQVIVSVREFRSQRVMITGQVQRPGYLPITDVPLTLIGALSTSGSIAEVRGSGDPRLVGSSGSTQSQIVAEYPDLSHVMLKRDGKTYDVNVQKVLAGGDVSRDFVLVDGDVIVVPTAARSNIFVLGEVARPGLLEVNTDRTDLADVLMASGGISQLTANASRVYVIRGDYNRPTVYQIDAGRPDAMLLAQKFHLKTSDVIYVAESRATRWNRGLQQILPTVQGLLSTAIVTRTIDDLTH